MPRFTNFPNGVSSLGIPTFGTGIIPPFTGNYFFVKETTTIGASAGQGTAQQPFNTISQALAQCTSGNNDVIFLIGTVHVTASIAWNKNNTHLVGLCAPIKRGKRARISVSGTTGFNNLVNVTANGCYFKNFGTFYGFANASSALVAWEDDGGRNSYDNVEFLGFGDGTASTGTSNLTGARAFKMNTSTGESTWRNCVFGVDTTVRNATNYTLEIAGGAPRLTFENCDFESDLGASGGASSHVLIGAAGIDRYCNFRNCLFLDSTLSGGATAMAQVFNVNAAAGGVVLMDSCTSFGATAWETAPSGSIFYNMVTPAASQAGGKSVVL